MELNWKYEFTSDLHNSLFELYKHEWWTSGRLQKDVVKAFDNSDVFIAGFTPTNELAGFARVLSDFTFKAFIFDLIVNPNFRGQHVGKKILDQITSHKKLSAVQNYELYCPDHIAPFYEKYGFVRSKSGLYRLQRS